jgi:isocitrate/isopropylmalate dehydrogenase
MVENAVRSALGSGARTADIARNNLKAMTTREMGDAVLREIQKAA